LKIPTIILLVLSIILLFHFPDSIQTHGLKESNTGVVGYCYAEPNPASETIPLLSYYNPMTNERYYSTTHDPPTSFFWQDSFILEGDVCYITLAEVGGYGGGVPLYRYHHTTGADYGLTTLNANWYRKMLKEMGYLEDGIIGQIWSKDANELILSDKVPLCEFISWKDNTRYYTVIPHKLDSSFMGGSDPRCYKLIYFLQPRIHE